MHWNGFQLNLFFVIYLTHTTLMQKFVTGQQNRINNEHLTPEAELFNINGNLYDIFKKRLDKFSNDLYLDNAVALVKNRTAVLAYGNSKKRWEKKHVLQKFNSKKSSYDTYRKLLAQDINLKENHKYSVNKRRVDKKKDFEENAKQKTLHGRSAYEELKKRLNEVSEPRPLHDGTLGKRNGRQSSKRDLYDVYKKEVDKVQRKLADRHAKWRKRNHRSIANVVDENLYRMHDFKKLYDDESNEYYYNKPSQCDSKHENIKNKLFRRHVISHANNSIHHRSAEDSATYPAVLTKALESSLNPLTNITPKSLLETVAQKMNTTTLDLAKKLTTMNEPSTYSLRNDTKLNSMLEKYIENMVLLKTNERAPKQSEPPSNNNQQNNLNAPCQQSQSTQICWDKQEHTKISAILDKVLNKLETIQMEKTCNASNEKNTIIKEEDEEEDCVPEGMPCDIVGSWSSLNIGLHFEIALEAKSDAKRTESANTLTFEVQDCSPPKTHYILNNDWSFMGGHTMKQIGGPFYIYSQKQADNIMALFAGYCRTCGEVDTIFGTWTFVFPSKDCQDIFAAFEFKNDIWRRYTLDVKRQERFKEMLYERNKNKILSKSTCGDKAKKVK